MPLNRTVLQALLFLVGLLAVYAAIEPQLTEGDDLYVLAQPSFYLDSEMAADPRAKRYASSLRFGKRAAKGWASSVRFG